MTILPKSNNLKRHQNESTLKSHEKKSMDSMHVMFNTKSIRKIWLCWCVNMRRKSKKWRKNIGVFNAFLGKCPHFASEILSLCSFSVCNLSGFTTTCFSIPCGKAAFFGSLLALPWLDPACIAFLFRQRVSWWFECRP